MNELSKSNLRKVLCLATLSTSVAATPVRSGMRTVHAAEIAPSAALSMAATPSTADAAATAEVEDGLDGYPADASVAADATLVAEETPAYSSATLDEAPEVVSGSGGAVAAASGETDAETTPGSDTPATPAAPEAASAAQPNSPVAMQVQGMAAGDVLHIVVGQSLILRGLNPMRRIYVGNPTVLQTYTTAPEEVVVTAKAAGSSSLVIWDAQGQSRLYKVSADVDPAELRKVLASAYPGNVIEARGVEDKIALTGTVPTLDMATGAAKLAAQYGKEVVNSLRVVPVRGKQVQLKLRIAEVDRTKLEQFGINLFRQQGNVVAGTTTGQYPSTINVTPATGTTPASAVSGNPLNVFLYNFGHGFGVTAEDLAQAQVLQILAEPTLTTMSGQPARFLSGGEFPFPIVQGGTANSTAITIEFKSYGVKVDFTPTVNGDGSIRLKIAPEVSTLDFTNAVTISGFTVPALATRRSETEVEIKDGQSFVLSGLLDHTVTDTFSKIPGIASVPILGELFKSKNMKHAVTELIIMVTATVVDPLSDAATTPEPRFIVPTLEDKKFDKNIQKLEKVAPPANDRE